MRSFTLLFAALLSLVGVTAKAADPVTEGFEYATDGTTVISVNSDNMGLSNGWVVVGSGNYVGITTGTSKDLQLKSGSYVYEGTYSIGTQFSNSYTWLVCPVEVSGTLKFYARRYSSSSSRSLTIGLAVKDGDAFAISNSHLATYTTQLGSEFTEFSVELGDDPVYVAFKPSYAYFDNVTYTPYEQAAGPALAVKDGNTKLTSPYAYDFGLVTAGTTKTFMLSNPGTEALTVDVSETGSFGATLSSPTIPANGQVTLTVTPETTGSGAVTITPDATSGIEPFVINLSGTIRDANKLYEYGFTALPADWTTTGTWYYNEEHGAYATAYFLTTNARLITPLLTIAEGETFFVEAKGHSTDNTSYQHLQMQYSADGTTWTNFDNEPTLSPSNWQTFSFTGVPAGKYYIAINACQADVRMFYGGELPNEPKMVVTQPTSLDYGVITEAMSKTFTIANTGKATLDGISVMSSNAAFTLSGVPASLEAGESAEVTITMAANQTGVLSSDITVSATGMDNVQFTVTGVVLPEGMAVVDFNDNALPAGWANISSYQWSFSDGKAYCTNASELTTPKLRFAEGDILAIKVTSYDNYDNNYLEITGSADGINWNAFDTKKYISRSQIPYGSYATLVIADIPTTVKYLKFKGYYVRIDEIAGLTYAPVLAVTQNETAVSTPAIYDFGEIAAETSVTYNFSNAGAGTINLTNVEVTGDGAVAYSTNWTESVAAPFDLVITRSYDANRAGTAMNAVVTVATSEGDFIINVTGTDKASNAPELSLTPDEAATFGAVTEATSKTYTVTNAGTGTLSVDITSSNEMFTVAPAKLEDIAAGESKTFDVTFTPVAETFGTFTSQITVTPTYDNEAAIMFEASAQVKDPNVWSENFEAGELPSGWEAGSNWTIADGVAKAAYAYGSTSYLTTPTLTVAGVSDELTFDYKATANYVSVKIQMSKDGAAFADYQTISSLDKNDAGTYTITGLEAGQYQFRFANDDYELDNFEGFKLNLADHIVSISSFTIPESSNWTVTMKEGKSFDATVTVVEGRGVSESLTAKLYMDDEVIGTQTGSVEAKGTQALTITATPTKGAPEGAQMHIEVEYAGGTLTTEAVTRYVAAITYLTLDETGSEPLEAGTYDNVTLKRTFSAGWNTVCLPFTISDVEAFFGTGAKAYDFTSYADGNLDFSVVTSLNGSYPYIVYVPEAITEDILLHDITIENNNKEPWYTRKADANNKAAYFRGTYAPVAAGEWTKNAESNIVYGVTPEGRIAKAGSGASIKGFRGYFDLGQEAEASGVRIMLSDGGVLTGVNSSLVTRHSSQAYDLQGRRVSGAEFSGYRTKKGVYIIEGKKVIK